MAEDVWRAALEEIGSWESHTYVDLHGAGEPLLHPQLFDIIAFAKERKNISVGFLSNATLLDGPKARAIAGMDVDWIGFSVDGSQKEVFEHYRKGAVLDEVEKNIEGLLRVRKNGKPNVYLNMTCHAEADTALFVDKWKGKVDTIVLSVKRNYNEKNKGVALGKPCPMLYEQLIMGWDGRVALCCEDYHVEFSMGSFPAQSLREIWNGVAFSVARRLHEKGAYKDIEICRFCDAAVLHEYAEEVMECETGTSTVRRELPGIKPEYAPAKDSSHSQKISLPEKAGPKTAIVRGYKDGDEVEIVTLFKEVFGREMTLDEWNWKYKGQGKRVCSAVIELPGHGIVGHYGGTPLRMIRDGVEIKGIAVCDVMTRKEHRAFTRLKKVHTFFADDLVKDSYMMFYGFPNERNLLLPSEKLRLYERIETIYDVVKDTTFNNNIDRFSYKLFPMSFDDERIDTLWDDVRHEFRLAVIRDRAYLKWRYGENRLFRYELLGLRKRWSKKLSALAVVKREGNEKLFVMDMVFGEKSFLPLLSKTENLACSLGMKKLSLWVPGRFHKLLVKRKFSLIPFGSTMPRFTHPLTIKKDEIVEKFFYTMGDTDFL